jgi:hypothetical protein
MQYCGALESYCDFFNAYFHSFFSFRHVSTQRPHPRVGGGHLHLEYASHFRGANGGFDTLLMRNFIVDISNRPLLFLGGLSRDLLNAPPLAVLPAEQQVPLDVDADARFHLKCHQKPMHSSMRSIKSKVPFQFHNHFIHLESIE